VTELAIRTAIVRALTERGCWVLVTTGVALSGTPDILACHEGRFVALEVKQNGGYPSRIQRHRLAQIKKAGGEARVVRSVAEALEALDA